MREELLQGGYYQPLQHAVVALLKQLDVKTVLDIGCGEGYYTSAMQQVVEQCVGVDIAKKMRYSVQQSLMLR